jgi:hypothetical protein
MEDLPLYEQDLISRDLENGFPIPQWLDPKLKARDTLARDVAEQLGEYIKPNLLDPIKFIEAEIDLIIDQSSATPATKNRTNGSSSILVEFNPRRSSSSGLIGAGGAPARTSKRFELREIVTDRYRSDLKGQDNIKVRWPLDFPDDLIHALETANVQKTYSDQVVAHFSHPATEDTYRLLADQGLVSRLAHYAELDTTSDNSRKLIAAYLACKIKLKTVYFRDEYVVTQAACLEACDALPDVTPHSALIVFLGAPPDQAIIELPADGAARRAAIESSKLLEEHVFVRLSLYDRLKIGTFDMNYTGIEKRGNNYLRDPSLTFYESNDIISHLFYTNQERLLSDIDTLVSTDGERVIDQLLEIANALLTAAAMVVLTPTIGAGLAARPLVSFLFSMCSVGVEVARGSLADHPADAEEHYTAATIAALTEIIPLLLPVAVRRAMTTATKNAINTNALKRLRFDGVTPPIYRNIPKVSRYIMPSELGAMHLKRRLLERLSKGPNGAQDMVYEYARIMRKRIKDHDVVIYRGQVFRGDMRPPETLFKSGFELRTPLKDIQDDIHQITGVRGGFGGGRNALDPDGKGISTSAFYYREHTGAFVYGGQKGGYTYIIDNIDIDGYHLYANHHMAKYPNSRSINLRPTEINYGENIPADMILGAYDPKGRFIPNHAALEMFARRRASEIEIQLAEAAARAAKIPAHIDR